MTTTRVGYTPWKQQVFDKDVTVAFYRGDAVNYERLTIVEAIVLRNQLVDFIEENQPF